MKELRKVKGLKTKLRFLCKNGVQTVAAPKIETVRMSDLKNRPREIEKTNKHDRKTKTTCTFHQIIPIISLKPKNDKNKETYDLYNKPKKGLVILRATILVSKRRKKQATYQTVGFQEKK